MPELWIRHTIWIYCDYLDKHLQIQVNRYKWGEKLTKQHKVNSTNITKESKWSFQRRDLEAQGEESWECRIPICWKEVWGLKIISLITTIHNVFYCFVLNLCGQENTSVVVNVVNHFIINSFITFINVFLAQQETQKLTRFVLYSLFQESVGIFIKTWKFSLSWFLILVAFPPSLVTLRQVFYIFIFIRSILINKIDSYTFHLKIATKPEHFKQMFNF